MFSVAATMVANAECGEHIKAEAYLTSNNSEDMDESSEFSLENLSQFVLSCLHTGRISTPALQKTLFLIPDGLAQYIAREIKTLSHVEPYGVRGCTLSLGFQDRKAKTCVRLGKFPLDPSFVSTFEISLCFKEDALRNILSLRTLRALFSRLAGNRQSKSESPSTQSIGSSSSYSSSSSSGRLVIGKDVDVVKKKLYRSSK